MIRSITVVAIATIGIGLSAGCATGDLGTGQVESAAKEASDQSTRIAGEITDTARDAVNTLERIQRTSTVDDQAKAFFKEGLNHSNIFIQERMIPLIHTAIEAAPDQKDWLIEQVQLKAKTAPAESRDLWERAVKKARQLGADAKTRAAGSK